MQIISGKVKKPFNVLLYGQPGAGKSTWASKAPNPIFIASDELDELDSDRGEKVTTLKAVNEQLDWLIKNDHKYNTIVVDTIDAIEKMAHQEILAGEKSDKTRSLNKACGGYGNAFDIAVDKLTGIRDKLATLREAKKMNVITLCHSMTKVTNDPLLGDSYTEYYLSLHQKVQSLFIDWVSAVLFLAFSVTKSDKDKFAYGDGERVIHTQKKPGFEAKNRYHLDPAIACPESDPFSSFWEGYQSYFELDTPPADKILASIDALMVNVTDDAMKEKAAVMVGKYKDNPAKLLKVKANIEQFIGG